MEKFFQIAVINLQKSFNQNATKPFIALNGINTLFYQNCTYAITGISGSGKSTLLYLLAGLETPSAGAIWYNECDLMSLDPNMRQRLIDTHIGLVFQRPSLIKELSVLENIVLKGLIRGDSKAQAQEDAYQLLKKVGLVDKARQFPSLLSGGEQQRVALARALYGKPSFLIADELTAHLDTATKHAIVDLILEFHITESMGIIMSTHDYEVAKRMQITIKLHQGTLIASQDSSSLSYNDNQIVPPIPAG